MIRPLLRFLEPITSGGKGVTEDSGPIVRATLRALGAMFGTWPDHIETMQYIDNLGRIAKWLVGT